MSFIIRTAMTSNASGRSGIIAKGHGKQRTVPINHAYSPDQNAAAAVGALLNVMCDERQKGMLRHPSGKQRVRVEFTHARDAFAVTRKWTINV